MQTPLALAFPFVFATLMLIVSTVASTNAERVLHEDTPREQIKLRFGQYAEAISVLVSVPAFAWGVLQLTALDTVGVLLWTIVGFVVAFVGYSLLLKIGTRTWRRLRSGLGSTGLTWITVGLIVVNLIIGVLVVLGIISPPE